ncbi:GntT/GntP/DsdX family permease [Azospirillum sp. sgz301742]
MSEVATEGRSPATIGALLSVPLPLVMLLAALALGMAAGLGGKPLLHALDAGFGASLAEYALILIPAFVLAASLSRSRVQAGSGRAITLLAPLAGAGMACPDTAYAALSSVAGTRKLSMLFGAYAGFKLLVPAGPAIVATGLGGFDVRLAVAAVPVFFVAWGVGLLFARRFEVADDRAQGAAGRLGGRVLAPLATILGLLALGLVLGRFGELPPLPGFLVSPKGALLMAAVVSLLPLSGDERAQALDSGMRRTAPLLLTIGAASALGAMLAETLPVARYADALVSTGLVLPALFVFTATFKVLKGSSMATFAGTTGIVSALLPSLQVSPEAAALAMCAGAFVSITPNDSLYWLVRQDAFAGKDDVSAMRVLTVGSALQGCAALATVCVLQALGLI